MHIKNELSLKQTGLEINFNICVKMCTYAVMKLLWITVNSECDKYKEVQW